MYTHGVDFVERGEMRKSEREREREGGREGEREREREKERERESERRRGCAKPLLLMQMVLLSRGLRFSIPKQDPDGLRARREGAVRFVLAVL